MQCLAAHWFVPERFSRQKMKKYKHDPYWGNSVRRLPWDDELTVSNLQSLVSKNINDHYVTKHKLPSDIEVDFINSLHPNICKFCSSDQIVKCGKGANNIQRYKCKCCGKRFNTLTNTIFDGKKISISQWIDFLLYIFEFHTIKSTARDSKISSSTGHYWLKKVFKVLENIQDNTVLEGNIYLDEIFFPVIKSKTIKKDGKKLRGISRNRIAVAVALDDFNHILIIVENTSKPSDKSTWNALGNHIKPKSHLIHDAEKSHGILIRELELSEEVYKTDYTKKLDDQTNPLRRINHLHSLIRKFMNAHGGYDRDNLQDWMNLIAFILSEPINRYEKVVKFIEMAVNSDSKLTYRDLMSKKVDDHGI